MRALAATSPSLSPPASLKQLFTDANATGTPRGNTAHTGHPDVSIQYPSDYDGATALPLLLFLHPFAGSSNLQTTLGLDDVEDDTSVWANGTLALHPFGELNAGASRYWNATRGCCDTDDPDADAPDDVAYLGGLVDEVIAAGWNVDADRIFVIGGSNGAFMALRLVAERSDLFAAAVAISGAGYSSGDTVYGTAPGYQPVSILEAHGSADGTIGEAGGTFSGMAVAYPATHAGTMAQWDTANGCSGSFPGAATSTGIGDYDSEAGAAGSETDLWQVSGCPATGAVDHWHMIGTDHSPVWTAAGTAAILAWLEAHHR